LIQVSPLTLKRRFNPYATNSNARIISEKEKTDARQKTSFASLFTVGSIKALAEAQVDSVTLFQTVGDQGIVSIEGNLYPAYSCLQEILDRPYTLHYIRSSNQLKVDGLLLESQNVKKLVIVNYTNKNQEAHFENTVFKLLPMEVIIKIVS
jgi:hypothetical protein